MAAGAPVVASAVGGIPDVVEDGVHGYLIAPTDEASLAAAVKRLLEYPAVAREMGSAARARIAATCSVPVVVDQLDAVLRAAAKLD